MTVKQISLITMKSGQKANLPDSLDEAEICFTTDTGEIFIGAPNFPAVQYRSDQSASTNGQGISPFRNIKVLTEFDVTKTITGDFYTQEALDRTVVPLTGAPYKIYTFESGVNSIIASYSLYDGQNVNLVGELFISVFEGDAMVCNAGQQVDGIQFTSKLNSSNEIELYSVNATDSIYTMYISAKCWKSNVAEWDGTKGKGIKPFCLNMKDEDNGLPSIAICTDVKLSDLSNNQFLKYNSTDKKWENTAINYSDITGTIPASGEEYLKNLKDVKLSSLSDNQFLKYNETDKKWENTTISYSDISGDIPEGKSRISELLDVKLNNLSDKQFLKYNASESMWDNVSLNYSDISGTPPATTPSIATCSDVKLSNLSNNQILQYSGTDQKWENVNLPPTPASWTVSTVAASGSTISDATICTTSLINVSSSDGYSKGVASIVFDKQLSKPNGKDGYEIIDISYGQSSVNRPAFYPQSFIDGDSFYSDTYYPETKTGSGSGFSVSFDGRAFFPASYLERVEINLSAVSVKPTVGDTITGHFRYISYPDYRDNSSPFCEFKVTEVGSTTFTMTNTFKSKPDGSTSTDDILSLSKGDIVYLNGTSRPNNFAYGSTSPFIEWMSPYINFMIFNPYIYSPIKRLADADNSEAAFSSTQYNEDRGKYSFVLNGNLVSCRQYIIFCLNYIGVQPMLIETPGQNYNVKDIVTFFKTYDFQIRSITSVPTRGIVLPDSQSTGSMVIVKNNTDNKPINVYSTISNNMVSTIPDSSYKNYETKFIRTDKGWTKF